MKILRIDFLPTLVGTRNGETYCTICNSDIGFYINNYLKKNNPKHCTTLRCVWCGSKETKRHGEIIRQQINEKK